MTFLVIKVTQGGEKIPPCIMGETEDYPEPGRRLKLKPLSAEAQEVLGTTELLCDPRVNEEHSTGRLHDITWSGASTWLVHDGSALFVVTKAM